MTDERLSTIMNGDENQRRKERIAILKKVLIIALIVLLVFPTVMSIIMMARQNAMQQQIQILTEELAKMKIGEMQSVGRIDDCRLVDLDFYQEMYPEMFEAEKRAENGLLADADFFPDSEEVVWSFASSGELTSHKVYLTFDDGPSIYTDDILDILDAYGVKATFFVVGKTDDYSLQKYQDIVSRGHTLGMHSYTHVYSQIYASEEAFTRDLDNISGLLQNATGIEPAFYRFPGGSSNEVSPVDMHRYISILDDRGITYFDWNVSSGDATSTPLSASQVVSNSIYGIEERDTSIILLHDSATKYSTVQALPELIEAILSMDNTELLPITADTELIQHIE